MGADLDRFEGLDKVQDEGVDVPIIGPDGEPLGWTIRVAGPDSARAKRIQRRIVASRVNRRTTAALSSEEVEAEQLQGLAELTIGWSPVKLFGGDFPYSAANAKKLYSTSFLGFVRDQVNIGSGDRAGFFEKLSTGSAKPSEQPGQT